MPVFVIFQLFFTLIFVIPFKYINCTFFYFFLTTLKKKNELYPYGLSNGDTRLSAKRPGAQNEDISSEEIKLKTNIKFFSNEYGAIYVRTFMIFIPYILIWLPSM